MNKEEFINSNMKLSKEDMIEDYYKTEEKLVKYLGIEHENYELKQENKQLKDNWNMLKEYIGAEWYCFDNESVEFEVAKDILNKMQELEQGGKNDG